MLSWICSTLIQNGFTPLSIALQQGHKKVVEELIQTDRSRKVKLPSLHLAAKNNNTSAVHLFLNSPDADPNLASKVLNFFMRPIRIQKKTNNGGVS